MTRSTGQYYPFPLFLVLLVLCLMAYTLLHEAGQAIFTSGGISEKFASLSGPMFPVLVIIFLLLLIPKTNHIILEASKTILAFLVAFSLVGKIIAIFLYRYGYYASADVIGFFSQNPAVSQMMAVLGCLLLITIILLLIGKKANYLLIPGLYNLLQQDGSTVTNRKKKVILSLIVLLSLGLAGICFF
jgi:hypothetical protein